MKTAVHIAIIFALVSIGCFFLRLSYSLKSITVETTDSLRSIAKDADDLRGLAGATLFQAEEVLHHTDQVLEAERLAQAGQTKRVNKALDQLTVTLADIDQSQAAIAADTEASLRPVAPLLLQAQDTLVKTGSLENQLQRNLVLLEPAIGNLNVTAENISHTTKAIDTMAQAAVKPSPLWKRVLNDLWVPAKLLSIFY